MTVLDALRGLFGQPTIDALAYGTPSQEFLRDAADMGNQRLARYALAEKYYDGDQDTKLAGRAKAYLEASGLPYVENLCAPVLDAQTNRMRVTGVEVANDEQATEWLNDHLFGRNRFPIRQRVLWHQSGLYGDGFVFVEPDVDDDQVCLRRQRPTHIKPVYGDDDEDLRYVVKVWDSQKRSPSNPDGRPVRRMNLFYPDRIEKYFAVSKEAQATWAPWLDDEDVEAVYETDDDGAELVDEAGDPVPVFEDGQPVLRPVWPTPWTMDGTPEGEPIGILGVHFRNRANGRDFGVSELRAVIPQQDRLMKDLLDLFEVQDTGSLAQPWVAGVDQNTQLELHPGDLLKLPKDATAGRFDAVDPRPQHEMVLGTMKRIAAVNATPLHELLPGGTLPSGESLKTAEGATVHRVLDREGPHAGSIETLCRVAARVGRAFGISGAPDIDPAAQITVTWDDPHSRNAESEATMLEAHHRLGASQHTILTKLGYDPDEEAKRRAEEQKASLEAAQKAFDAGSDPRLTPPPPGGRQADGENPQDGGQ